MDLRGRPTAEATLRVRHALVLSLAVMGGMGVAFVHGRLASGKQARHPVFWLPHEPGTAARGSEQRHQGPARRVGPAT